MHFPYLVLQVLAVMLSGTMASSPSPNVTAPISTLNPNRYTSCAILDQGYQPADAAKASEIVVTKLITTAGRAIRTNYCYYNVLNATIAGVCNGSARNRTITADEVRRGFEQIVTDCGNNSGYHVVNNLTFSAYGLVGGIKALVPKTFDYPDFPGWSNEPETIPVR